MITSSLDWAILAILVYAYGLVAGRLKQTLISGAVVFLLTGLILGPAGLGWLGINVSSENLRTIAELTLASILFTDAASANLQVLRDSRRLPIRLLALGLPLTILMGMGMAQWLLPQLSPVEAAILSVVLAPTDAALGQSVVTNPAVPPCLCCSPFWPWRRRAVAPAMGWCCWVGCSWSRWDWGCCWVAVWPSLPPGAAISASGVAGSPATGSRFWRSRCRSAVSPWPSSLEAAASSPVSAAVSPSVV
ncbi:cation:proton antiporter [Synechococcus sp. CS-1328]|nr:cation:proton antiporter [Synechococcus sp. CS-1328]